MKTLFLALALLPTLALATPNQDGEEVPAGEADAIARTTELIRAQIQGAADKEGHAFRDAHRKSHGCVKARFEVTGGNAGLFTTPATYQSVIRFSNGDGQAKDDHDGDGRGMAVKVLGVQGERNLSEADDEATSQDFLMINHPVFFVRNAADYVGFQEAATSGHVLRWLLNPFRFFHEGLIAKAIQDTPMTNPLESKYWSMTASKLGNAQMKFRAIPCDGQKLLSPSDSADRLAENLKATLAAGEACFLFQVQTRTLSLDDQPVEDPTVEWKESDSPFTTVARITIPSQLPENGESCEALSFNPWNGLATMRPLGGISRARRSVYQTISRLRHDFNHQRREEPRL